MLALIKNGSIPKEDTWVMSVIEFFVLHGMFSIEHANKKSAYVHVSCLRRTGQLVDLLTLRSTIIDPLAPDSPLALVF